MSDYRDEARAREARIRELEAEVHSGPSRQEPGDRRVIEPQRVLVVDPPWRFSDKLGARGAEANYRTQTVEEIRGMWLPPLHDDCHLFLWRVGSMVEEAYSVVRAWGFVPKSEVVWIKTTNDGTRVRMGMGRTVRNAHETCIVASRGSPRVNNRSTLSVLEAPLEGAIYAPRGEHSRKPEAFYDLVEELCPGPYFEMYARRVRPGWQALGDEL